MTAMLWVLGVAAGIAAVGFIVTRWRRVASTRIVNCPETGEPRAVELDAIHRLANSALGSDRMRVRACSRWPERSDCDQRCIDEIASSTDGCFVRATLDYFYQGASCALCKKPFGDRIDWSIHEPGLIDQEGIISRYREFPVESMEQVLAQRKPVCWDCTELQRMASEHPELVTVRPHRFKAEE